MKTCPSVVRIAMGAAVCVVISSAVAAPWQLPKPLGHAVHYGVNTATDAWLLWGYGISEHVPDVGSDEHPNGLFKPALRSVRAVGDKAWKGTRQAATWLVRHAREAVILLSEQEERTIRSASTDPHGAVLQGTEVAYPQPRRDR